MLFSLLRPWAGSIIVKQRECVAFWGEAPGIMRALSLLYLPLVPLPHNSCFLSQGEGVCHCGICLLIEQESRLIATTSYLFTRCISLRHPSPSQQTGKETFLFQQLPDGEIDSSSLYEAFQHCSSISKHVDWELESSVPSLLLGSVRLVSTWVCLKGQPRANTSDWLYHQRRSY